MRPYLKLYPVLLLLSFSAAAQKNFQDGYVVVANGDTLKGQIDYRQWATSPEKISFLQTATGKTTLYTPDQILSFHVSDETYNALRVRIYPYSKDAVAAMSEDFNKSPYERVAFLRWVTGKKLSLYCYKDSLGVDYYFTRREADKAEQLRLISRITTEGEHSGMVLDEVYKNQLTGLLADCDAVSRRIAGTAYSESSLRKLIFAYNNCGKDTGEQIRNLHDRGKVVFMPMIGYLNSKVHFHGDNILTNMDFPSYGTITGGAGVLFILPRNRQQFSFLADLLYNHFYSHSNAARESTYIVDDGTLDHNLWNLDIQFRYRYPKGGIRPFVQAGFSNSLVSGNKGIKHMRDELDNSDQFSPILEPGFRTYWIGFLAGAGVTVGRWGAEARMARSAGPSELSSTTSPVTNFYFLVSYSL